MEKVTDIFTSNAASSDELYSIYDIANWFLTHVECDQKKLQKLCFYAQAWYLALYGKRLCNAYFEAWVHGPVNRQLWDSCRGYGFEPIPNNIFSSIAHPLSSNTCMFMSRVLATYGKFTGFDLECLTHTEDYRQHRTKNALRLCTHLACIFSVILHKFRLTGVSPPALNLYNLPKNLTAQYAHNLCAVLPIKYPEFKLAYE